MTGIREVMLHTPDHYYHLLCELWVDKISHAGHWRVFILSMMSEWKSTALWVRHDTSSYCLSSHHVVVIVDIDIYGVSNIII